MCVLISSPDQGERVNGSGERGVVVGRLNETEGADGRESSGTNVEEKKEGDKIRCEGNVRRDGRSGSPGVTGES